MSPKSSIVIPGLLGVFLSFGLLTSTPSQAVPGDEYWSGDFFRIGISGQVNAVLPYDNFLVAGGDFFAAGGLPVHNLATWDGQQWGTLGSGVEGEISTLIEYDGSLIVAGNFSTAGGVAAANIARWDGAQWQALGSGSDGPVSNLGLYEGQLIALGDFSSQLGAAGAQIAAWDGSNWTSLGSGPDLGTETNLLALTVFNGSLMVAGEAGYFPLQGLAQWDGTEWSNSIPYPGNQPDSWYPDWGHISVLGVYQGEIIAGGHFSYYDEETDEFFSGICRWNGSQWVGLAGGLSAPTPIESDAVDVMSLLAFGGQLLVGGLFWDDQDNQVNPGVALWDGNTWQAMGEGLYGTMALEDYGFAKSLTLWNGQPVLGGSFCQAGFDFQRELNNITVWEEGNWQSVGPQGWGLRGSVRGSLEYNGRLVIGGSWQNTAGNPGHLASLGPEGWEILGGEANNQVNALALFQGQLVIGGAFTEVGGASADHVAAFNGDTWQALGDGIPVVVEALSVFDGDLYAGSYRWNGEVWTDELQTNGAVHSLAVWDENLFAGGSFSEARGVEAAGIVGWNGEQCFPLGAGVTHFVSGNPMSVYALASDETSLLAGGDFTLAGETWAPFLARWSGDQWNAVSDSLAGAGSNNGIFALTTDGNNIFAGGRFIHQGMALNHLGRWDGNSWHSLGSGVQGENIFSLLVMDHGLWVGGNFETAGGRPAFGVSSWSDPTVFMDPSGAPDELPTILGVLDIHPNPFNPRTRIAFNLDHSTPVDLAIFDLRGRRVSVLVNRWLNSGSHQVVWDGTDALDRTLPSGTYFVRLVADQGTESEKVMLVR